MTMLAGVAKRRQPVRDAFVSYATRDSQRAHLMCAGLSALGIRVWLDVEDANRSRATWREAVQRGISESRATLIALSPHWDVSPACQYELAIALERRMPVLAVTLPGGAPAGGRLRDLGVEVVDGVQSLYDTIDRVAARLATPDLVAPPLTL
jgi:hypothetical protein